MPDLRRSSFAVRIAPFESGRFSTVRGVVFGLFSCLLAASPMIVGADELVPTNTASRFGMVEAWRHQLDVGVGAQSIVDQKIHVSAKNKRTYVELVPVATTTEGSVTATVLARFSANVKSLGGTAIGEAEATRLAKNEQRRMTRRGIETQLRTTTVNEVRIYVLTDRGALEAIDGESGEVLWSLRFGNPRYVYGTIGCDDDHVVVVNGTQAFVIDASDGGLRTKYDLKYPPIYGPVISEGIALFPGVTGTIEGLYLNEDDREPYAIRTSGVALAPATAAVGSGKIAWSSAEGYTFVMNLTGPSPSMDFRLDTAGTVNAKIAAADGERFFFATTRGQLYAVEATREGRVLWNLPVGEPMYDSVFVVGDKLYAQSGYGNLYSVDAASGQLLWDEPASSIDDIIGVVDGKVFARSSSGMFVVLDASTGKRIATVNNIRPTMIFPNTSTDRIYMVSGGGTLQCLRPEGGSLPTFRSTPPAPPVQDVVATDKTDELDVDGKDDAMTDADSGIGGAGDNPFGADGDNPFGDMGDNPFDAAGEFPF